MGYSHSEGKGNMEERIKARIAQLEAERDRLVAQANQRLSAYEGAIGELKALLQVEAPPQPAEPEAAPQEETKTAEETPPESS